MQTDDMIIVKAKVTMKTAEEGGRQSGFKSGYRPNHVFRYKVLRSHPSNLWRLIREHIYILYHITYADFIIYHTQIITEQKIYYFEWGARNRTPVPNYPIDGHSKA